MTKQNFLLGKGERLTEDVIVKGGGGPKSPPYTFAEARSRLAPMLSNTVSRIDALPEEACPDGKVIASLTLNPEFIAKSYYPMDLFRAAGVSPVGSRPRKIKPEKRSRGRVPEEVLTTEFFVLGSRETFHNWQRSLPSWTASSPASKDLASLEEIAAPEISKKIKGSLPASGDVRLEVVLHSDALEGEHSFLSKFQSYLGRFGLHPSFERRFYAGGLCFLEMAAPVGLADEIATFTIVRALREMPQLRVLRPTVRSSALPTQALQLPTEGPVDPNIRVAIFDGGVPSTHPLTQWATPLEAAGVGPTTDEFQAHGVGVTSSLLFGHIDPTNPLPRPFTNVDHHRVLDSVPGQDPHELYEVLDRIDRILESNEYDFISLSIGPQLPIEDDDVHAWTAVMDDRLARTDTLVGIAVGNDGEGDAQLGLNRIQVPADCVNAIAIGACNTPDAGWTRAPYSSVGPGRSPGIVKPDLVEFGGSIQRPFLVVARDDTPSLDATGGTSFATPSAIRLASGIRAHFGPNLSLLSIRALLVHCAERSEHPRAEVGWGRVARALEDIVICDDDTIRVVYQGAISPTKYVRAPIPMPPDEIKGNVTVTATICYKSQTDPHHPGNYTRAGLEIAFRPRDNKFSREGQVHADTKSFFGDLRAGMTESELRRDAWKWENCIHAVRAFRGSSLRNPCFDIHYNSRLEGRNFTPQGALPYALVVSVHAKNIADLYDQVVRKYATVLEPLRPTIEIPVRT